MPNNKEKIYAKVFKNVFNIYDIFKNAFGEDKVDLQGVPSIKDFEKLDTEDIARLKTIYEGIHYTIMVYWPNVTVTNEQDKSIDIQDLYAKVQITLNGTIPYENIGFTLNRARYTKKQFFSKYCHSHVPRIQYDNLSYFAHPCLGRGPIRDTITTLKSNNLQEMWMLFCCELGKYVTVESLSGVPYVKLSSVGASNKLRNTDDYNELPVELAKSVVLPIIKDFIKYYLEHGHLKIAFSENRFIPGMVFYDYLLDVSNCFIEFFNKCKPNITKENIFSYEILKEVVIKDGKFWTFNTDRYTTISNYIGTPICTFKNKEVTLQIEDKEETINTVLVLSENVANFIIQRILTIINYNFNYGNNDSQTSKAVLFI